MSGTKTLSLLSSHGIVLLCIARDPDSRLIDIAKVGGMTERSAFGLMTDLIDAGIIQRAKVGRRNRYIVNPAAEAQHVPSIAMFLSALNVGTS